jgi:hypothetical protein
MVLPGRGVPLAVRVPERVKGWLVAGVVVLVVRVMVVGVRAKPKDRYNRIHLNGTDSTDSKTRRSLLSRALSDLR